MVPGNHAPTGICWAYENRTSAIRIPSGPTAARRIEHRVAGGDVNPYLMLAAVLGAAINGIEDAQEPPAPITGNAYDTDLPQVPSDWAGAISAFETCPHIARIFSPMMVQNFVLTKKQEQHRLADADEDELRNIYLETV
jgi:glutamine synthetase